MAELDNKVALVTGAASGIGRATANRLAQEGAHVIVADLDQVNGKRVADEVKGEFLRLDVGDPDNWSEVIDTLRHRWGGLDIAHLNAGVTLLGPGFTRGEEESFDIASLSEDDYRRIRTFLREIFFLNGRLEKSWQPYRFDYCRWHPSSR